jgi:drug/metabolite transporter (DMT)-like permease
MDKTTDRRREALGLAGFLLVATAQVSNMILARGVAGTVPPFTIAFFRWSIVAAGSLPAVIVALRENPFALRRQGFGIAASGFLGMFLCGGPAGITTSAINIALIMALSPLIVMAISWALGLDVVGRKQVAGMAISLAGAALIITKGRAGFATSLAPGDLLALLASSAWAGYTLLQNRVAGSLGFLARIGLFAAAGALFSLPFANGQIGPPPHCLLGSPRSPGSGILIISRSFLLNSSSDNAAAGARVASAADCPTWVSCGNHNTTSSKSHCAKR